MARLSVFLGPHYRFGDKLLGIGVRVSPKREGGPEGVKRSFSPKVSPFLGMERLQ